MRQKIEELILQLQAIAKDSRITELKIVEKTKSVLKARLFVSAEEQKYHRSEYSTSPYQ